MRVTAKGQITIPAQIREYLGILPHDDVDFQIRGGLVVLIKAKPVRKAGRGRFAGLRGILAGRLTTDQWMKATRGP